MKFQDFHFNNYEEMFAILPENQKLIVENLRTLIFDTIPEIREKLSYNVPFYKLNKNICFIWPGAIPWGKLAKDGVELGFTSGHLLMDTNYLTLGNRKYVSIKTFYKVTEINEYIIRELLQQASEIDHISQLNK